VSVAQTPGNLDDHYGVIAYIAANHSLPTAELLSQAFHPPLYYLLAAPLAAVGHVTAVRLFSLSLALLNFWLISRLVGTTTLIQSVNARRYALALAAFLPQFVSFSLFVSNDTLAYTLGTATFTAAFLFVDRPRVGALLALAAIVGLGLLTKWTLIASLPLCATLVFVIARREKLSVARQCAAVALFVSVAVVVGGYKFVENWRHFGRPLVHNLDFQPAWTASQRGLIGTPASFVKFDLPRLVADPFDTTETRHSVPMLLYATTWYSYIHENNFDVTRSPRWSKVTSALCVAGIVPSLLAIVGFASLVGATRTGQARRGFESITKAWIAVMLFVGTVGVFVVAGIKYTVWQSYQGRYAFSAAVGALLLIAWGYESVLRRLPAVRLYLDVAVIACTSCYALYYAIELPVALANPIGKMGHFLIGS
jgi:4-amino-4-deoxy-L-arabinose transferase-like glycosyltransferase